MNAFRKLSLVRILAAGFALALVAASFPGPALAQTAAAPKLVVVPPGWWHGFAPLGAEPCVVVNCPDLPYDPDDEERDDVDAAAFWEWGRA